MNRREFLLEMRKAGQLKGTKPCFIILKPTNGHGGQYIMSYRDGILYFQKISRIFNMLRPKDDFKVIVNDYVCYKLENLRVRNSMMLYKANGDKLIIEYMIGTRETLSTEENIERIIKDITMLGIKRME